MTPSDAAIEAAAKIICRMGNANHASTLIPVLHAAYAIDGVGAPQAATFPRPTPLADEDMPTDREWTDYEWVRNQWHVALRIIDDDEQSGLGSDELRAALVYAVEATSKGPAKWLVPSENGPAWLEWLERARAALGPTPTGETK